MIPVFGTAHAHHCYFFANARASRIKLPMHDGLGVRFAARRVNADRFMWPRGVLQGSAPMTLMQLQFDARVPGLRKRGLEAPLRGSREVSTIG